MFQKSFVKLLSSYLNDTQLFVTVYLKFGYTNPNDPRRQLHQKLNLISLKSEHRPIQ